jgi:superfamily II DNA or RNA helicase
MGSGKTSAAINLINNEKDTNFIYITPYLDEVKRIKTSTNRKFYEPEYYQNNKLYSSKFDSLHALLSEGKNIVSTHALFKRANRATRELIYNGSYTLILDEVMDVVEHIEYK